MKLSLPLSGVFLLSVISIRCAALKNAPERDESLLNAQALRCEYLQNPLGIDETAPRLSWELTAERRGERQTAYEVLVASTPELLASGVGDLWESGKIASAETAQVAYVGKPLASREACFWKVRAWDRDGQPGPWSAPARWEMGLLHPGDWSAKWLEAAPVSDLSGPTSQVKILHASYESPDRKEAKDVTATVANATADGRVELKVDNKTLGGDPAPKRVKQLRVDYQENGQNRSATVREGDTFALPRRSLPYLRKSFTLQKPIRSARLYATALGLYEISLNGNRAGDHALAPDWTDYNKRVQYQAYDVTPLLKVGANAIGVLVANGWYSGHIGNGGFQYWGKTPALLAQLEITYADGSVDRIVSDDTWKERGGPILTSDFMLGEAYDANLAIAGWDKPGLDESQWRAVTVRDESARHLVGQVSQPVREIGRIVAKSVKQPAPGEWVYDLGQNMVGVVRLTLHAPAGTQVTVRHAEMLNPDGTIYTANLRGAPSIDTYTLNGAEAEVCQPHFTFHGFRYVELTGLSEAPPVDAVVGIVLGSDTPAAGEFSCSDPRINQLQSNIQWGQRGNYLSVPTDCPQRDERLGWMGDAQVFIRTATFNSDVAAFFTKWLTDVSDDQLPDGRFPNVTPRTANGSGSPAWADAGVICPWTIYQAYGDKRLLERQLPGMIRWIEACRERSTDLIRDKDRGSDYGDWLSIGAKTPKDVIGTAYFAYSTHLVAKACRVLNKTADAERYETLFEQIKAAFNKKYVSADGRIKGDTQCVYAMALKFELLPEALRPLAAQYLEQDIKAKGWHLSTGFVGVSYLLPVLTNAGKSDTAYRLLLQDTFPSWLFSVKQGATTIWERWDGWTPEKGFQNPGMNSFNHYSLGSCGEWLFESVAGIDQPPDQAGFDRIVIRPRMNSAITSAKGSLHCIHGRIASEWKTADNQFELKITIPVNTTAEVYVPTRNAGDIQESAKPAIQAEGVRLLRQHDDTAVFEVGSGTYDFTSPMPVLPPS